MMYFKVDFDKPTAVSQGSQKDALVATVIDPAFFSGDGSYQTIEEGKEIVTLLPKLLPGEEFASTLESAGSSVQNTA